MTFVTRPLMVSPRFVIVSDILFLMASKTHICSSIIINFAYCQNIPENKTIAHHNINNQMMKPLSNTFKVISLNMVIVYVYGQKEKASAFNSNIVKKSLDHFHMASDIDFFFLFKKLIIADIPMGYKSTYHIVMNMAKVIINRHIWLAVILSIKYWNNVKIDSPFSNLYINTLFIL